MTSQSSGFGQMQRLAARMGLLVLLAAVMAAVLAPRRALAYDYCQPASVVAIQEWIKRQHGTTPSVTKWEPNCETKNVNENQTDSKVDVSGLVAPFPGVTLSRTKDYLKRQMKPDQGFSACRHTYLPGGAINYAAGSCPRRHNGVDFGRLVCPGGDCLGDTVVAMMPGTARVTNIGKLGEKVEVTGTDKNNNTIMIQYNHLAHGQVSVRSGQQVSAGTTLGKLGHPVPMMPHLDLKVKKNSGGKGMNYTDPVPFIDGQAEGAMPQQNVCDDPPEPKSSAATSTNQLIAQQHEKLRYEIIKFLREHAGQLTATMSTEASRSTEQQAQFLDRREQQKSLDADNAYRTEQTNAHLPTVSGCQALSGVRTMYAASRGTAKASAASAADYAGIAQNKKGTSAENGTLASANARTKEQMANWCDPATINVGSNGMCTNKDQDKIGLDSDIDKTLFSQSTLDTDRQKGAVALIQNVTQSVAPTPLRGTATQTPSGIVAHMERMGAEAQKSAAAAALAHMRARRMPSGVSTSWVDSVTQNLGSKRPDTDSVSENEVMETMYSSRLQDPAWYQNLQAAPADSARREQAILAASRLMLAWKMQELMSDWSAVRAAQLARSVAATRRDDDYQTLGIQKGSYTPPAAPQLYPNGEPISAQTRWLP